MGFKYYFTILLKDNVICTLKLQVKGTLKYISLLDIKYYPYDKEIDPQRM